MLGAPRLFDVVAGGTAEDRGGIDKLGGGVLVEAGAVVAEDTERDLDFDEVDGLLLVPTPMLEYI